MKRLSFLFALIACAAPAFAAGSAAPPIDSAALAHYAHGSGTVSGSVRFLGGVQAVCAPDIPYVAWYVEKLKTSPAVAYDPQMIPFTHLAQIRKDRGFTCEGLAPGPYLVWVEGFTQGFPGPIVASRPREDSISGQVTPGYYSESYGTGGSDPQPFVAGPQHLVVPSTGTTNVTL